MPILSQSDIEFNFKRSYDDLPPMILPVRIVEPQFGLNLYGGISAIQTYTNKRFPIKIYPDFFNPDPLGNQATALGDNYRYFFDMGDGTIYSDLTAEHYYKYPGEYEVTLVLVDSATNFYRSEQKAVFRASDVISDSIFMSYMTGTSAMNSTFQNPINIQRYNSYQSWGTVSAEGGYTINLNVSGNRSTFKSASAYYSNIDSHLQTFSAFVRVQANNQGTVINSIKTNNDFIYGILNQVQNPGPPFFLTPEAVPGSIFLGTSGTATFYYYED